MATRYFHIPVPSPPTAFYHDMLLTEHWAIIVDSSLRREPSRLLFGKGLAFFNSSYNMRFRVSTITKDIKRYLQPIQVWTSSTKRSGSGGDDLAGVQWSWPCLAHCLCLGGDQAEGGRSFEQNSFRFRWWCGRPSSTATLTTCRSTCQGRSPATSPSSPSTLFLFQSQRRR